MTVRSLQLAGAALAALGVVAFSGCAPTAQPAKPFAEQSTPPPRVESPSQGGIAAAIEPAWVEQVAEATGIPERALAAYAGAAIFASEFKPGCGIGWNTIAAVGFVESDHARHAGSMLDAGGTAVPAIVGVALDGGETASIPDTDDGALDGDSSFDRAVGPMQLIPESWRNWGTDGNFDGIVDPQNIDDAAFAAANYLCRASDSDMVSAEGWRQGIAAYNSAESYIIKVADAANRYLEFVG